MWRVLCAREVIRTKTFFSVLAGFVFCVCLVLAQSTAFAESPRQCVETISQAIDQADVSLFSRKVDVDSLVGQALDLFLASVNQPGCTENLPPMLALALSQAMRHEGAARSIRSLLFTEARGFLLHGVASGAFAGRKPSPSSEAGYLAPLFANASLGRKEIVQIGEGEPAAGGWIVPFTLLDDGNGMEYAVNGFVTEVDGALKLTKIVNLPELFAQIQEEARQFEE